VLGCGAGAGLSYAFSELMRNVDGTPLLPMKVDAALLIQAFALSSVVGLAASALPARRASRLDPAEAIRHV
jgi:lipoprotein-releasing system permease protein